MNDKPKQKRGFAAMSLEKRRMIASMGGKSVPPEKRNFADKARASAAGKKSRQKIKVQHG
jgi:general stress protein YciG